MLEEAENPRHPLLERLRADLTESVFQAVGLSRTDSAQMVEDMLEEICGALAKGETVKLSSFGTFAVRQMSVSTP